jgi:probable F420-dependent oxidoreductase
MKVGIVYPQIELEGSPEALREFGLAVELMGFDHLLTYEHILGTTLDREPKMQGVATYLDPFHDPFTMFSYLAAITTRIEFVTSVIVLPQRPTALVAKQATDIDLLSRQRFRLGVGAGWNYVEYQGLGQDFHTRGQRLDEQIPLLRRLWSESLITFEGRFDRLDRADILPRPKRQIPILVGGFSELAFRRGGRLGDGFIFIGDSQSARGNWQRVQHYLHEANRSEKDFERHLILYGAEEKSAIRVQIEKWRDAGGTHLSISPLGKGHSVKQHLDRLAETREQIRGI